MLLPECIYISRAYYALIRKSRKREKVPLRHKIMSSRAYFFPGIGCTPLALYAGSQGAGTAMITANERKYNLIGSNISRFITFGWMDIAGNTPQAYRAANVITKTQ